MKRWLSVLWGFVGVMYPPPVTSPNSWLPPSRRALSPLGSLPKAVPTARPPPSDLCWHLHLAFSCFGPTVPTLSPATSPQPRTCPLGGFSLHWGSGCTSSGGLASPPAPLAEQVTIVGEDRSQQGGAWGQSCCPDTGMGVPTLQWGPQLLVLSTGSVPLPWHGLEMGPWHYTPIGLAS